MGEEGSSWDVPYFHTDDNPKWPIFVKPIHYRESDEETKYNKRQEDVRKDVERYFGFLQGRFQMFRL